MNFSIVIPLYNKEKYIAKTIESILNQKYSNYEIIIIDDGSTDRSVEVVNTFAQRTNKVRLYKYDNAGVSVARNRGVEKAEGDFIIFLDADDMLCEDYLSDAYNTILKINSDFTLLGYNYTLNNKAKIPSHYPDGYINYFEAYVKYGPPFCSSSVILNKKRVAYAPYIFPEGEWLGEDIYAWSKIILGGGKVYYRNKIAAEYIIEASGAMKKKKSLIKLIRNDTELSSSDPYFENFLLLHKKDYLKSCIINGDTKGATVFLSSSKTRKLWLYELMNKIPHSIIKLLLRMKRNFK